MIPTLGVAPGPDWRTRFAAQGVQVLRAVMPLLEGCRVHLFGVGPGPILARARPYSSDATTWQVGSRFTSVFTLTRFPILKQVVVSPKAACFDRREAAALVPEMARYGSSWSELASSHEARMRYNVRMLVAYMAILNGSRAKEPT